MIRPATVRVPASTSNLGSGFDALGLAVRRYLTARFEPGEGALVLRREGTLARLDVPPDADLLRTAFLDGLRRRGVVGTGGSLVVSSEIPVGRGLGASAAAIVGGLLLGAVASGDSDPDRGAILGVAAGVEGHGDNAAPAVFGGLVAVAPRAAGGFRALPLDLSDDVAFAFAAPPVPVSTAAARRALPAAYPRGTVIGALGRLASLLYGLAHADGEAIAAGLLDDLHVPYRLDLIGGGARVLDAAVEAGAWGATISGSGSGLLAVCHRSRRDAVVEAMARTFGDEGHDDVIAFSLEPEPLGACPLPAGASTALAGGSGGSS